MRIIPAHEKNRRKIRNSGRWVMAQRYTQRTDSQPPDDRTYSPEVTSFEQSPGSSQCRARISPLVTDLLIIIDSSSFVKKNFSVFYKFFKIFSTAAFSAGTGEHSRRNSPMVEAVRTALELIPRPSGGCSHQGIAKCVQLRFPHPPKGYGGGQTLTAIESGTICFMISSALPQ